MRNWKHISGTTSNFVVKEGAGVLQSVTLNRRNGTEVTLFDGGDVICSIDPSVGGTLVYNAKFEKKLSVTTIGNTADVTVVFD